ncbi:MAG: OmpA family protein [Bacteroidetes bacterium]|nr:MAG: OmpA family protein [Bacteroidota bacterium]
MKKLALICMALISLSLQAQNTQWASEVIEFSSQYMSTKYSADQILGQPNSFPKGGDSKLSWSPKDEDGKLEFIKVKFDNPMPVQQVVVYENHHPGAVSAVYLYDENDKEYLAQEFKVKSTQRATRILEVNFPMTSYNVAAVKVEMVCKKVEGFNQIDAIAISNSTEKVEVKIEVADDVVFDGEPENLGPGVNTDYSDQYPVIAPDGQTMFFVRRNHPGNMGGVDDNTEIWVSQLQNDGTWGIGYNIGPPLNNTSNNFVSSVTPDGNSLLLGGVYLSNGSMGSGVSMSQRNGARWAYPVTQSIDQYVNHNKHVSFFMSNSGKYMIMAIEMDDSKGGMDMYVSVRKGNGQWSKPTNFGSTINTAVDEFGPFLASDDRTFYFSSYGHPGFGSADIFITKRLDDTWTNWSKPKNLGSVINGEGWDAGYTIAAKGDYAYFNSARDGRKSDIYRIKLPQALQPDPVVLISGKVFDHKTKLPIEATVYYEFLSDGSDAGIAHSNPETGEYKIVLPYGHTYGFRGYAKGYISVNQHLDLVEVSEYKEIETDLFLVPIEVGQVVRLNNIFFETGKATLKKESFPELNRVVELMEENPTMKLEIAGHTDNVGSETNNQQLSQSRAEAVVSYLVNNGVSGANRLIGTGYGERMPIADNDTDLGRQLNRRVEFKILNK